MKASELMIGDFFLYKGNVVEIVSIDGGTETVWIDGKKVSALRKIDDLQPIPLTPEILEKNGWEYNNYNNETENEEEYYVDENGFDIHINGEKFEVRCIDAVNIQLKYLHELQHALKLCGIEKTIEL